MADPNTSPEYIERFWRHVYGGEKGLLHVWTARRAESGSLDRETISEANFPYPKAVAKGAEWALEKSGQGREVYFCAHLLNAPKRVKENAVGVRALWGDLDGAEIPNGELKPTAVVESSPQRFHCYWRVDSDLPPQIAEQLNRRIAAKVGADPSGFDLTQLLRVPGTVNHKYPDTPEVKIANLDAASVYSAAELDRVLPRLENLGGARAEPVGDEIPSGSRNKTLTSVAGTLRRRGLDEAGIFAALQGVNQEKCHPPLPADEVAQIAASVSRYKPAMESKVQPKAPPKAPAEFAGELRKWPELDAAALYGLTGEIVRKIAPHTEADPVAVLANLLVAFGNAAGRGAYVQVGADQHHLNTNVALVGKTAKGRKGMSWGYVRDLMHAADAGWADERVLGGLSSGEGLINAVRDRVEREGKDGEIDVIDAGESDKRLLVLESEFAAVLKVMTREGNTLSTIVRQAWDGDKLATLTRNSPLKATGAHISIIGHVTKDELTKRLSETDTHGGFTNRIVWLLVKRSQELPYGGKWGTEDAALMVKKLRGALEFAKSVGEIAWGESARPIWEAVYGELSEGGVGLVGAATSRAEAHVLRLAVLYAVMDWSPTIESGHLLAALALWEYAEESARYVFGASTGDPVVDRIMEALRESKNGLTRNQANELFGGHQRSDRIREALGQLERAGLVRAVKEPTKGRPVERWFLA